MSIKLNNIYGQVESINEDGRTSLVESINFGSYEDTCNITTAEQWFDNYLPEENNSISRNEVEKLLISVVACVGVDSKEEHEIVDSMLKEFHCSYKFVAVETYNKKTYQPTNIFRGII